MRYRPILDGEVAELVANARKPERAVLFRICHQLADDPHQSGDFVEESPAKRPLQVKRFGDWQVRYWADHGACELRIVHIQKLKR